MMVNDDDHCILDDDEHMRGSKDEQNVDDKCITHTDDICNNDDNVKCNSLICGENNCMSNNCVTHGKKWAWKSRSKCYRWVTTKKKKVKKSKGLVDHNIVPVYTRVQPVQQGLDGISDSGDQGLVEKHVGANQKEKVSG